MTVGLVLINMVYMQVSATGNILLFADLTSPRVAIFDRYTRALPSAASCAALPRYMIGRLNLDSFLPKIVARGVSLPVLVFAYPLHRRSAAASTKGGITTGGINRLTRSFFSSLRIRSALVAVSFKEQFDEWCRAIVALCDFRIARIVASGQTSPVVFTNGYLCRLIEHAADLTPLVPARLVPVTPKNICYRVRAATIPI